MNNELKIKKYGLSIVTVVSFFISISAFVARVVNGYGIGERILSSDMLLFPALYRDLFVTKIPFFWKFSSQLYFFPEFLTYLTINMFSKNFVTTLFINGVVNIFMTVLILFIIYRLAKAENYSPILLSVAVVLLAGALENHIDKVAIGWLFTSVGYYGAFLFALIGIIHTLYILDYHTVITNKFYFLTGAYVLGLCLTVISDPLFIIMFYIPLGVFLGLSYLINNISVKKILLLGIINTIPIIVAILIRKELTIFIGADINSYISIVNIGPNIISLFSQLQAAIMTSQIYELILVGVIIVLSLLYLIYLVKYKKEIKLIFFGFLASIFPICNLLAVILSGTDQVRYLLAAFIMPIIFFPLLFEKFINQRFILVCSTILIILAACILINTKSANQILSSQNIAKCVQNDLDYEQVRNGIGDYGSSRAIELFLNNIKIAQINNGFQVFHWLNNSYDYVDLKPEFIIFDPASIQAENINPQEYLGSPDKIYNCGNEEIFIYKNNQKLRNLFNSYKPSYWATRFNQ